MNTGPLNENELEWLDETLAKYATEGRYSGCAELDGLLTAILCTDRYRTSPVAGGDLGRGG